MRIGRNTIYAILREKGFIDENHKPNQELVDAGYLHYEKKKIYRGNTFQQWVDSLTVSQDGIAWLEKILIQYRREKSA